MTLHFHIYFIFKCAFDNLNRKEHAKHTTELASYQQL